MRDLLIRCSSLGKIMTEPTAAAKKAGEVLSAGAKTYLRSLAAQEIFGVDFEVSTKAMEKGIEVEDESIALLNRVLGLSLTKNTERRDDGNISGECDLHDAQRRCGYDLKSSWSLGTFPILQIDAEDSGYEWQARGYMRLWDADSWTVAYAMVDTPERLIGFEPIQMHSVSHIPEAHRLTTWTIERHVALEDAMVERVKAARTYLAQVIAEFDRQHRGAHPEQEMGKELRELVRFAISATMPVLVGEYKPS